MSIEYKNYLKITHEIGQFIDNVMGIDTGIALQLRDALFEKVKEIQLFDQLLQEEQENE